jgi:hypothetical protein
MPVIVATSVIMPMLMRKATRIVSVCVHLHVIVRAGCLMISHGHCTARHRSITLQYLQASPTALSSPA